jgi:hypothetical protein
MLDASIPNSRICLARPSTITSHRNFFSLEKPFCQGMNAGRTPATGSEGFCMHHGYKTQFVHALMTSCTHAQCTTILFTVKLTTDPMHCTAHATWKSPLLNPNFKIEPLQHNQEEEFCTSSLLVKGEQGGELAALTHRTSVLIPWSTAGYIQENMLLSTHSVLLQLRDTASERASVAVSSGSWQAVSLRGKEASPPPDVPASAMT